MSAAKPCTISTCNSSRQVDSMFCAKHDPENEDNEDVEDAFTYDPKCECSGCVRYYDKKTNKPAKQNLHCFSCACKECVCEQRQKSGEHDNNPIIYYWDWICDCPSCEIVCEQQYQKEQEARKKEFKQCMLAGCTETAGKKKYCKKHSK